VSAQIIRDPFVKFLGVDIGVSFVDANCPSHVILYRPDRLSDQFVRQAYVSLKKTHPDIARDIERLIISFETNNGRTQRGVEIRCRRRHFPSVAVQATAS
jgi:hypothetical protein